MEAEGFRLRDGAAQDLEAMYRLDVACFEPPFRFSRTAMRQFAGAAGAITLVAESDSAAMAGFVIVQMDGVEGYVVTLDVGLAARRQGVARLLMRGAERRVAEQGVLRMKLHVWAENVAAIRFYEGSGYTRTMLHRDFYGKGLEAFGYAKELGAG